MTDTQKPARRRRVRSNPAAAAPYDKPETPQEGQLFGTEPTTVILDEVAEQARDMYALLPPTLVIDTLAHTRKPLLCDLILALPGPDNTGPMALTLLSRRRKPTTETCE